MSYVKLVIFWAYKTNKWYISSIVRCSYRDKKLKDKHPHWAKELKEKAEHYDIFRGGYFQSERILYAKWYIIIQ